MSWRAVDLPPRSNQREESWNLKSFNLSVGRQGMIEKNWISGTDIRNLIARSLSPSLISNETQQTYLVMRSMRENLTTVLQRHLPTFHIRDFSKSEVGGSWNVKVDLSQHVCMTIGGNVAKANRLKDSIDDDDDDNTSTWVSTNDSKIKSVRTIASSCSEQDLQPKKIKQKGSQPPCKGSYSLDMKDDEVDGSAVYESGRTSKPVFCGMRIPYP